MVRMATGIEAKRKSAEPIHWFGAFFAPRIVPPLRLGGVVVPSR
jgi:hypothetical protein